MPPWDTCRDHTGISLQVSGEKASKHHMQVQVQVSVGSLGGAEAASKIARRDFRERGTDPARATAPLGLHQGGK